MARSPRRYASDLRALIFSSGLVKFAHPDRPARTSLHRKRRLTDSNGPALICVRISERRNYNYNFSNEQFGSVFALAGAYAWERYLMPVILETTTARIQQMDKDRIKGSAEQAKGAVKESAGKIFGDKKLETKGKADKAAGKIQNAVGGLKDAVRGK
jgi:uncharacterized protein YjbJ (UPF0337 family)